MKIPPEELKKIALFRARQLGDMLCAIPAIRALHNAYPDAEITLLGLPWAETLIERYPAYIHKFKHFPGYPGLPEQPVNATAFARFLTAVQKEKFDLVLQMQGDGSIVNPVVELFNARYTAGFYSPGDYRPNQSYFLEYPEAVHEIERNLALIKFLGIEANDKKLEFPLNKADIEEYNAAGFLVQPQQYVCIHPGSPTEARQWPVEYFTALGNYCSERGLEVVLTGTKDELPIVEEVARNLSSIPTIAAGKTSLGSAAILIKNAIALISHCTGLSHIAAAFRTPSVVVSMCGETERWAPPNKEIHRCIDWSRTPSFELVFAELKNLLHILQRDHSPDRIPSLLQTSRIAWNNESAPGNGGAAM